MRTLIFATAIRVLTPLFLTFSLYILFRGHNHPGGGFIGGLIGSIAFVFHLLAHGSHRTAKSFLSLTIFHYPKKPEHSHRKYLISMLNANLFQRNAERIKDEAWNYYLLRLKPTYLMAIGLLVAAGSGIISLFFGKPFMTGMWMEGEVPLLGALGTPILFDAGVYMLVLGMVLKMVFTMSKD